MVEARDNWAIILKRRVLALDESASLRRYPHQYDGVHIWGPELEEVTRKTGGPR
jgi:hypothetical protein